MIATGLLGLAACTSDFDISFGPPGGLEGKMLPSPNFHDAGGGGVPDGGMQQCTRSGMDAGKPDATGSGESGVVDEGGMEGTAPEGGVAAEGGASEGGGMEAGASDAGGSSSDCTVSWSRDIFPNMTAAGLWQCTSAGCHGGFAAPAIPDDPKKAYAALSAYTLFARPLRFLVPCSKSVAESGFYCLSATTNCGNPMPLTSNGAKLLTKTQIDTLKTWISCGSLDN